MKNFLLSILNYVIDEERGLLSNIFFNVFRFPLRYFCLFALSVLCSDHDVTDHMYHTGGGRKGHKKTYRQRRIK
jgi:hypothetical protein